MRSKLLPFITLLVLLTLLPSLAFLQYRWQGQVSEALRNQLEDQMRRAAGQMSADFDRQIARVYESFQFSLPESAGVEQRPSELRQAYAELYAHWLQSAPHPDLVSDIYFITQPVESPGIVEHFRPDLREFESVECPADLRDLLSTATASRAVTVSFRRLGPETGKALQLMPTVDRKVPAIGIPIADPVLAIGADSKSEFHAPVDPAAEVIVRLNLDVIRNELLPELAQKYLQNSDGTSMYSFAVIDLENPKRVISSDRGVSDANRVGDIAVAIFSSNPLEFSSSIVSAFAELPAEENGQLSERRKRFSFIQQNAEKFIAGFEGGPKSWQLVLTHRAGSLDAAVERERARNLAIGFGILLLLGISMSLTLVSVQRERRLAGRQMEFVSAVSHELRTPLAVICSAAENLADGVVEDAEQIREYGKLVRNEGRRLSEMVEQVLDFAGIQSGRKTYRFESVHVRDIIDRALETFDMQIRESGIAVEKRIPLQLPDIQADRSALVRALQNLIANALKYGTSGKWLSVRAELAASVVFIIVQDRGAGISQSDLPHIFEPFYRARSVLDAQIKGSGLGLALVKQIIEAHGATITVDTAPNQGSSFKIAFPIHEKASGDAVATMKDEPAHSPR